MLNWLFRRKDTDWYPVVRFTNSTTPIRMKRRVNGKYEYREPTEQEVAEYAMSEAW